MNNSLSNSGYDGVMHPPSRRRTAPAGSSSPRRDPQFADLNLSERPSGLNYSNEVEMYTASRIPLSYNLRKNIPPEYSNSHTVAQYYPGSPASYQAVYRIPRANSPRTEYMYSNPVPDQPTTSFEIQDQYGRNLNAIGATSGTMVTVPETDIIDSSTEEDEVIKDCDNEEFEDEIDYENDGGASSSDELDDPEVLALFEREQIVEKYEKGPEQEGIDSWENPDFELYHKTDRFGFIHKEGLTEQEIEKKEQMKERRRCLKWDAMYKEWEHREPTKMKERIWKGIPESYRIRAWSKMLHIEEYKRGNENKYQELLVRGQLLSKEVKQIDLDVNRTYRDNVAFMKRYDISQKRLFHILTAYSMYNTEVGYCQGMNHIVALLIMYMSDDEDAFWGLHSLLANKKYTMHGFFVPSFPKLRKFEDHFLNRVLPKYAPRVHKHFEKLMLPPIYLPKWWFGCFLDRVPFKLVLRIWDVFLFLGDGVLMAMALNIFKMHEKKIVKMSMEQFMDFIQRELPADFGYTDDQVMNSLKKWLERLQDDKMALPARREDDFPSQELGLILKRSLVDIRMDIAEIHSRSSRANLRNPLLAAIAASAELSLVYRHFYRLYADRYRRQVW
ncbi:unnamed protein product [Bursaphelenchus xylophilus]|nr:unnamed protein product [Bursaphelenchus xylophilus]CAG9097542.1 unnamed protein product [Bursaphelenchus xylophilus]